jgi:hypothetical protein
LGFICFSPLFFHLRIATSAIVRQANLGDYGGNIPTELWR